MCEVNSISLGELPSEVLLNIFKYLKIPDLLNLKCTCWRFRCIINSFWDQILFAGPTHFLVTNQLTEHIRKRSARVLLSFDKHRISNNWTIGRYDEGNFPLATKCIPCFHLEKNRVWLSRSSYITGYERQGCALNIRRPGYRLNGFKPAYVCKFVVNDDLILSGNGDSLRLHSIQNGNYIFDINLLDEEITCVDMVSNIIAVGSRNNRAYLYQNTNKGNPISICKEEYDDRIWAVSINDGKLAIGTAANCSSTSLIVFDVEKCQAELKLGTNQRGAGILNFKWENNFLLWSGGYDSFLRKWDLRTGQCVQHFLDPWMSSIYCFDYDFINTVITGCESNGRAVLWDIRKDKYVQMYYMKSCTRSSSPVYGLSFDAEHLFAVTEQHINILDFSTMYGTPQDYSDIFKVQIVI